MAITIRPHVPGFVDGLQPEPYVIGSLDALLELPCVRAWAEDIAPPFYRFSLARPEGLEDGTALLMAEMDEGREWYVVGYLQSDEDIDLPIWVAKE